MRDFGPSSHPVDLFSFSSDDKKSCVSATVSALGVSIQITGKGPIEFYFMFAEARWYHLVIVHSRYV